MNGEKLAIGVLALSFISLALHLGITVHGLVKRRKDKKNKSANA